MVCSLLGCGLVLDLDPPVEPGSDAGRRDVGGPDVSESDVGRPDVNEVDAGFPDVSTEDVTRNDGAVPHDGTVVMADIGPTCEDDGDCAEPVGCQGEKCRGGICVESTLPDREACDDGLYCTESTTCTAGRCGGGAMKPCPGMLMMCVGPVCLEDEDRCDIGPINGSECAADNAALAVCDEGECSVVECLPDYAGCRGRPCDTDTNSDADHCGGCNIPCAETCNEGICRP